MPLRRVPYELPLSRCCELSADSPSSCVIQPMYLYFVRPTTRLSFYFCHNRGIGGRRARRSKPQTPNPKIASRQTANLHLRTLVGRSLVIQDKTKKKEPTQHGVGQDGVLDKAELGNALSEMRGTQVKDEELNVLFDKMDMTCDGKVSGGATRT